VRFWFPHLPAGRWGLAMLRGCYAMSGLGLIVSVIVITAIWQRLCAYPGGCRWITKPWWPI